MSSPFQLRLVANPANAVGTTPRGRPTQTVAAVASEPLSAGAIVHYWQAGALVRVRNANAQDMTRPARGFVRTAVAAGGQATIYPPGSVNDALTNLPAGDYYLGFNGQVTQQPPTQVGTNQQFIGPATPQGNLSVIIGSPTANAGPAMPPATGAQGPAGPAGATGPAGPAGATGPAGPAGGGITSTNEAASFTTGNAFNTYFLDTSGAAYTVTMNPTPALNEVVEVWDSTGHAGANPVSFNGNGKNISGVATVANFIAINYGHARLIYNGTQWLMQ